MIQSSLSEHVNGWFIGDFTPSLFKTKEFEVGVHFYPAGFRGIPHIHKVATEYNVIVSGMLVASGETLGPGDIFVYMPNDVSEVEFLKDTHLVIVKTPSIMNDKYEAQMNVLVTGGAGFIGSHIVDGLLNIPEVNKIRICDNLSTGNLLNLQDSIQDSRVDFRKVDLLKGKNLSNAMKDIDFVFHEAALPSVPKSIIDPIKNHLSGDRLTVLVLEEAKRAGVQRLMFAGSSSAYGGLPGFPKSENMETEALSPYAASKLSGEAYVKAYAKCYSMDTVVLRYFNVFGPRQDPSSPYSGVLSKFCKSYKSNEEIKIFGDGEQIRDFVYVKNVVHANILAMKSTERLQGSVLNVGSGFPKSLNEVIKIMNKMTGRNIIPKYEAPRLGDPKVSSANISKIYDTIGYSPIIDFETGLQTTYDWY